MNRNTFTAFVSVMVLALIATCCITSPPPEGQLLTDKLAPLVTRVVDRHDGYVREFEPEGSAAMLQESSELVTRVASQPQVATAWFRLYFEPVGVRHNAWVSDDPTLTPEQRRTRLRTVKWIQDYVEALK